MIGAPRGALEALVEKLTPKPMDAWDEDEDLKTRRAIELGETARMRQTYEIKRTLTYLTLPVIFGLGQLVIIAVHDGPSQVAASAVNAVFFLVVLAVWSPLLDRLHLAQLEGRAKRGTPTHEEHQAAAAKVDAYADAAGELDRALDEIEDDRRAFVEARGYLLGRWAEARSKRDGTEDPRPERGDPGGL